MSRFFTRISYKSCPFSNLDCNVTQYALHVSRYDSAMVRHLKSLRCMTRDHGWIHTLLEEAENERMHLLTALELRRPGPLFKIAVIGTQGEPLKES